MKSALNALPLINLKSILFVSLVLVSTACNQKSENSSQKSESCSSSDPACPRFFDGARRTEADSLQAGDQYNGGTINEDGQWVDDYSKEVFNVCEQGHTNVESDQTEERVWDSEVDAEGNTASCVVYNPTYPHAE